MLTLSLQTWQVPDSLKGLQLIAENYAVIYTTNAMECGAIKVKVVHKPIVTLFVSQGTTLTDS